MNAVTFSKATETNGYVASTGEVIEYITSKQFGIAGATGWYITEVDGEMSYNRFATLKDAKKSIIRRHNVIQYAELVMNESQKTLTEYTKVGA